MIFSEKLDFLMNITKTSNSSLALATSLDPSYISRLRSGKRLMPKNNHIIQSIAAFLARQFKDDLQKKFLLDTLKITTLPKDIDSLALQLAFWLASNTKNSSECSGNFFNALSDEANSVKNPNALESLISDMPSEFVYVDYGVKGKRKVAEYFLSEVAACETSQTLLLYSDEDTSWMTDDPIYAHKWAELMIKVISRGNKIKIIHTMNRDLDEMLSAISQWMPLYMSGMIEPYYYPKKRDGIFKHTLFIAPKTAAIVSSSIGEQISTAANVLYRNEQTVNAFSEEFMQYLHLCKPLMQIFTAKDQHACRIMLSEFEGNKVNSIIKTDSLSLLTMPKSIFMQIFERSGADEYGDTAFFAARHENFLEALNSNKFTELICLPEIDLVKNGKIKISMFHMLNKDELHYTKDEFIAHLEHIINLLETFENYHVYLIDNSTLSPYTIYLKEELGVLITNNANPPIVIAITENNMIATFWASLRNTINQKSEKNSERINSISKIKNYISKLKQS